MKVGAYENGLATHRDGAAKVVEVQPVAGHEFGLLGPLPFIAGEYISSSGLCCCSRLRVGTDGKRIAAEAHAESKAPSRCGIGGSHSHRRRPFAVVEPEDIGYTGKKCVWCVAEARAHSNGVSIDGQATWNKIEIIRHQELR